MEAVFQLLLLHALTLKSPYISFLSSAFFSLSRSFLPFSFLSSIFYFIVSYLFSFKDFKSRALALAFTFYPSFVSFLSFVFLSPFCATKCTNNIYTHLKLIEIRNCIHVWLAFDRLSRKIITCLSSCLYTKHLWDSSRIYVVCPSVYTSVYVCMLYVRVYVYVNRMSVYVKLYMKLDSFVNL